MLATSVGAHPRVASTGVALLAALVAAGSLIRPAAPHPFWLPASSGRWLVAPQGQVWLPVPMRLRVRADAPLGYAPAFLAAARHEGVAVRGGAAEAPAADGPSMLLAPATVPVAEPRTPEPAPASHTAHAPDPAPKTAHAPDPAPQTAHAPDPAPQTAHAPEPAPQPAPAPDPAPQTAHAPDPAPQPAPAPDPAPQPAPATGPALTPAPAPDPLVAPRESAGGGLVNLGGGGISAPARAVQAITGHPAAPAGGPGGRGQLRVASVRLTR